MTTEPGQASERPIIMVVAIQLSVHAARWLDAMRDAPFCFVLVPVLQGEPIAEFGPLVPIDGLPAVRRMAPGNIGVWAGPLFTEADDMPPPIFAPNRSALASGSGIAAAIAALRPALVHSMELQHAGYACFAAAHYLGKEFPRWLVSNWGSDFQLYRKLPLHQPLIETIARRMDAYVGECIRDKRIVRELGYTGPMLDTIPASCGADFDKLPAFDTLAPPSQRREVLIKGYHGWSGRALHILSAIHLIAPRLRRFRLRVALGDEAVAAMVEKIREQDKLDIAVDTRLPWQAVIERLASARMTVGLGISDGIGTTTLEAMALGSFPIAGTTSCAGEWLRSGRHGFIVDPHDVAGLTQALIHAIESDDLVDGAARRNRAHVEMHWNASRNAARVTAMYQALLQ
jgi:hypothetical protein